VIQLSIWVLMAIVPLLILLEGFFSGSEIALLSADKLKLKEMANLGDKRAAFALDLAVHPERVLSTTLLMTSLCVISTSALIAVYFLGHYENYGELLAVVVTSPLIVLFGELIPKTLFQRKADALARWVAHPVHLTYWVFFPITRILASYTTRLSRIVGPIEILLSGKTRTTRDDIRELLTYTKKETEITSSERQMIQRIFNFRSTEAKNALIPLVSVNAIEATATVQEALEYFERHRHSRMPVYSDRIDNIIGILETADLLAATDLHQSIQHFISPAHYAAETQALEDVMLDMRKEDNEMVVVVDEHGGAVGILTFEDIVEEIVGEINDEFDYESLPFKEISNRSWAVQAKMEIQQINEILKIELPEGDYKTISGFLLQQFGRIPEARDELFFDTPAGSFKFTIQKSTERHIESLLIEKTA
jgi:putative hemolysin